MTIITEEMFPVYRELEHPAVTNAQRTGFPEGNEPELPHCPVCGVECSEIYMNHERDILACDECHDPDNDDWEFVESAWEVDDCF